MTIDNLPATAEGPRMSPKFRFPGLARMVKAVRNRRADRLSRRHLDVVPAEILRDIGMTRPQVFAGVAGCLSAARP